MIRSAFEIAAGSVTGRDHVLAGRNNQDAYFIGGNDNSIIALVADGCSDGYKGQSSKNEVGAQLAVRYLSELIAGWSLPLSMTTDLDSEFIWEDIRQKFLEHISRIATRMGGNFKEVICSYFLFTIVGALINSKGMWIFSIGDGVYSVNGNLTRLGPFPGNAPPYPAYSLLDSSIVDKSPEQLLFTVNDFIKLEEISSVLIGTDGVLDLIKAESTPLPGKSEQVGPLEQFWIQDKYYKNPDMIRRRLALANHTSLQVDWESKNLNRENALLPDDTTLVVIRKKEDSDD